MRLLIGLMLALAPPLQASASSDVPLRAYVHTEWTQHDGMPFGRVQKILQTGDGYLWLITPDEGLLRFDGMRFVRAATPCQQHVTHATSAPDGGFWAICGAQLIRRTSGGQFIEVPQTFLRPRNPPNFWLVVDKQGRPWFIGMSIRYLEADGTGGRDVPRPTKNPIRTAALDADGTLWVSDALQMVHIYPDRKEFIALDAAWCLVAAREGGVFALTGDRAFRVRERAKPELIDAVRGVGLIGADDCATEAPDGGLWMGTDQHSVALLKSGRFETFSDSVESNPRLIGVFQDREGSIWAAATTGLHRFRKPSVERLRASTSAGSPAFVFVDSKQAVWVSPSADDGVGRLDATGRWSFVDPHEHYFWAIGEDETGRIWLSNTRDIGYVSGQKFVTVRDAANRSIEDASSFQQDSRGHLWASASGVGVYRITPGPPRLVIASKDTAEDFLVSDRFGTWVALTAGGVEQHIDGRVNAFPDIQPERVDGRARVIKEIGDAIWISTSRGLRRWRNGVWTTWTREHGLPVSGSVQEIMADRLGQLWIMSTGGLLRLSRAQLDAVPDGAPQPLSFARIGALDGVVPPAGGAIASPRASADNRGRLYFVTTDWVAIVDPSAVAETTMPPPIVLESVTVDNRAVDLASATRFVEPSRLQFDYTSLSLRSPENARFRYRLDGSDPDWIDAGSRRQIIYGTLPPGAYRFRVIGANSEGIWNEEGASFDFRIVPVFWRTWWFRLTMLGLGGFVVAALYRARVRHLTHQFNLGLEARVSERTRIARELHDTLLQSFQGVLIHFQAATNLLPGRPDDARRKLDGVLDRAARAITEARDAVQELRSPSGADDLASAISVLGKELATESEAAASVTIHVNVEGQPRALRAAIRDDIYRITGEALRNAVRHAQAQTIQVDIHYGERALQVRIRDDGKGIDPKMLEERGVAGHWGLPGMRERAVVIGGTLDVRSRVGSGTEIDLSVPAAKAYDAPARPRRFWSRKTTTEEGQ